MVKLRLEDVTSHKQAVAQARNGPFGEAAVDNLYKTVRLFDSRSTSLSLPLANLEQ